MWYKSKRTNNRKLLISFMGVGEPLLNLKLLHDVFEVEKELKQELEYDYIQKLYTERLVKNDFL